MVNSGRDPCAALLAGAVFVNSRWVVGLALIVSVPHGVQADLVKLFNGGEVRGELEHPVDEAGSVVRVRTLTGGLVSIEQSSIRFVTPRPLIVEE